MFETEEEAENFLWSICEGFSGSGWSHYDNTNVDSTIINIRRILKVHVDEDLYGHHCNARCYGAGNYGSKCLQLVPVDKLTCHLHYP